jgi:uncharacterized membrane protein
MKIEQVSAGRGFGWILEGFRFLRAAPLIWLVDSLLFIVVLGVLSVIPVFGTIAATLLQPILVGGLLWGCRDQASGGMLQIDHLLAGFRRNTRPLLMLGLVLGLLTLLLVLVLGGIVVASGWLGSVALNPDAPFGDGSDRSLQGAWFAALLLLGVGSLLYLPLAMAAWFAPALVMLDGLGVWDSLRASFLACLRNPLPFLLYGLLLFVLLLIALIPFGLGVLVWLPILFGSVYVSYRDIFRAG